MQHATFKMATYSGAGQLVRRFSTSAATQKNVPLPLKLFNLEGRYASALYTAAVKDNKLDQVEKEINTFKALVEKDPKIQDFLKNPSYQRTQKSNAVGQLSKDQKFCNISTNFFKTLAENGRMPKTMTIINDFGRIMSAHKGEITCTVTTAVALDAAMEKELRGALQGFVKQGQTLNLFLDVDPSIRGGMTVNFGDKFIDMSIATKMKKYTSLLTSVY